VVAAYELVDGFTQFDVDEVYIGTAPELIQMTCRRCETKGKVLIPATATNRVDGMQLAGRRTPVHYLCDERRAG